MLRRTLAIFAVATVLTSASVAAADACKSDEYKAFDFWVGEWQVHTPDGKLSGHNRITREYGGCVVHEHYSTARGYSGESLNIFDASRHVWHQTWVDSDGLLLVLEGQLRDKSMVLEGQTVDDKGQITKHRITWTPNPDGSVRQHWETADRKAAWSTLFDGKYTRQ